MRFTWTILLTAACALAASTALTTIAAAQPGPPDEPGMRGPRDRPGRPAPLTLEQLRPVWTWQAKGVARTAALDEAQTTGVAEAYINIRSAHHAWREEMRAKLRNEGMRDGDDEGDDKSADASNGARFASLFQAEEDPPLAGPDVDDDAPMRPGRGFGGGPRGDRPGMNALREAVQQRLEQDRSALKSALEAVVPAGKIEQVYKPLATFSPRWDQMVLAATTELKLDDDALYAVLNSFQTFVTKTERVIDRDTDQPMDREARRALQEENRQHMQTLVQELRNVLSEEQFETLARAARLMPNDPSQRRSQFVERMMDRFDENGDGLLQADEAPQRIADRFDELDKNGDGALDAAEMEEAMGRAGDGRRGRRGGQGDRGGRGGGRGGGLDL